MPESPSVPRPSAVSLRQLRAFVAVAREGSITRAARRLHLTPSALSMLVSALEGELGVRLFERTSRRVAPTDAARALLPGIERTFEHLDAALDGLRDWVERRDARLAIAAVPLLAATLVPPRLAAFRERHPGVRVTLLDLPVDAIAEAVRAGDADVGLCTADHDVLDLDATVLLQDRLMLACRPDHPFAARREVRWAELAGEPLALLGRGSGLRRLVEQGFAAQGGAPLAAFEVAQVATAVGLVEAGLALSVLPGHALASARTDGVVAVPLVQPSVARDVVALTSPRRPPSDACGAFLAIVRRAVGAGPDAVPSAPGPRKAARR